MGVNPDYKDSKGSTALILAAERNYLDVVKELLRCGADVNVRNDAGNTAFSYAVGDTEDYFISQGITK